MNNHIGISAAAIIFNTETNTYHPILYRDAPLPGPYDANKPERLKSKGHHTEGFATFEEAQKYFENDERFEGIILQIETPYFSWNGEDFPIDTAFVANGKLISL